MPSFESIEKVQKYRPKKVISLKLLHTLIKIKTRFFVFCNFFNGFEINIKFCVFDTHISFLTKKFGSYWHFLQTLKANADKTGNI
jgi:hypothetical protein